MTDEAIFLQAMQDRPEDTGLRLDFADWLEERGDPRGELMRLLHTLTQSVAVPQQSVFRRVITSIFVSKKSWANESSGKDFPRQKRENRLRSLLASGVQPVGPFVTNSIGMKFAWIPAGTFLMGSPAGEEDRLPDETQHQVTLSKGFYMAIYPVTLASWREVMGNGNPSYFDDHAVPVSWEECQEFLRRLSEREGHAYRLPTEAEWEYACRAGTTTPFFFGETISTNRPNCNDNLLSGEEETGQCRYAETRVGGLLPNAWGVHDMHGDMWQWCADWLADYPTGEVVDPQGPQMGACRAVRGGSFMPGIFMRSAYRAVWESPLTYTNKVGFRAARNFP